MPIGRAGTLDLVRARLRRPLQRQCDLVVDVGHLLSREGGYPGVIVSEPFDLRRDHREEDIPCETTLSSRLDLPCEHIQLAQQVFVLVFPVHSGCEIEPEILEGVVRGHPPEILALPRLGIHQVQRAVYHGGPSLGVTVPDVR